ncbi:hypothetical protein [Capillimicrobium parvum]|uniref:DUF485 domain-containing protein n=1 Tax=Capillimicrobium parvum TaxID=2884022 RepID=A0A9E7BWB5_9ACTN|nr:hypothetical protein [Capillimicrobium parvum]UGS33750.1 hypothetical protein DSM104329_00115 [Capillimicrobium parvum]
MAKKKDKKAAKGGGADPTTPRLSAHPKARRQIRAAKAWSGLTVFLLVQFLALRAGLPMFDAGLRALAAGVAAYVAAWLIAVVIWRQLAMAEVEAFRRRMAAAARSGAEAEGA